MGPEHLLAEIRARPLDAPTTRRFERVRRDVVFDEIAASCALAGAPLAAAPIRRMLDRGIVPAGNLADHLLVLGYARAALGIARERALSAPQRHLITVAEIQRLHVTITAPLDALRPPPAPPGAWRRANLPPVRAGMVTTPHWLIEFEMAALVDRIGGAPPAGEIFAWLADAYERLERIRPFVEANGRIARLVTNLLLARCGYPPMTLAPALLPAYRRALAEADAGDRKPLALVLERAVRVNLERLAAVWVDADALRPLAELVRPRASLSALRKAAQRERLRTVTRGREILSTRDWVDQYLAKKSRAGRPARRARA